MPRAPARWRFRRRKDRTRPLRRGRRTGQTLVLGLWRWLGGEIPEHQHSDTFMIEGGLVWRGTRLLRHLTERLAVDRALIDLNIHILWLLLASRPGLCHDDLAAARSLARQCETLLDANGLSPRSRRELSVVVFSLRSMGMTA